MKKKRKSYYKSADELRNELESKIEELKKLVGNTAKVICDYWGRNGLDNKVYYELDVWPMKPIIKDNKVIKYEQWGLGFNIMYPIKDMIGIVNAIIKDFKYWKNIKMAIAEMNYITTGDKEEFIEVIKEVYPNKKEFDDAMFKAFFQETLKKMANAVNEEILKAIKELGEDKKPISNESK